MEIIQSLDFDSNPPRKPCRIVSNDAEKNILAVNIEKIKDVLLNSRHKDKPLIIVSVSGKTRGGKSFLLNLLIKKLQNQELEKNRISKTFGFQWNGGSVSVTYGMWVWPEIYWRKDSQGREVGILLVDNQGMFDGNLDDSELTALVTVSTLISSTQIYNISTNITADHLQHILRFLVSGPMDLEENLKDLDQLKANELMFLVRDWPDEVEHKFGTEGGESLLQAKKNKAQGEMKQMWDVIDASFSSVTCFNLPHPGLKVTKNGYEGDLYGIEEDFLEQINSLCERLFCPEVLSSAYNEEGLPKQTGSSLVDFLKKTNGLPTNKSDSFISAWTDNSNERQLEKALKTITSKIKNIEVDDLHTITYTEMSLFKKLLKGNKTKRDSCLEKLLQSVADLVNPLVIDLAIKKYKDGLELSSPSYHTQMWHHINDLIDEKKIPDNNLNTRMKSFRKKAAELYYIEYSIFVVKQFKEKLRTIVSLEQLDGLHGKYIQDNFKYNPDFTKANKWVHKMHSEKIKKRTFEDFCNHGQTLAVEQYNNVESFEKHVGAGHQHSLICDLNKAFLVYKNRNSDNKKRTFAVAIAGILTAASFVAPPLLTAAVPAAAEAGAGGMVVAGLLRVIRWIRL